jgi:uncharacterized delta-60 repeat protein/uncharacterized repeat protein (TIGR01451 family)
MRNYPAAFLRSFTTLFLLIFFTQNYAQAQNPASPDTIGNLFNIGLGANNIVYSIVDQPDGKILVGGKFTLFNGISQNYLLRLNPNGSVDNTFNIGSGSNGEILSIAIQSDGKILALGSFATFNGISKNHIVRLNPNGSVDNTFNIGSGINNSVLSLALQPDGKVLVGGHFTAFNGVSKNKIVRINTDGSVDNTFNIGSGANSYVYSIALQADGKIIAGGDFTTFNGISKNRLVRLNANGTIDNTFNIGLGASTVVTSVVLQADGKILVGGAFTTFNGVSKNRLVRLNANGTIDHTFNIGMGANSDVSSIAIQQNGKILIGGTFYLFNGISQNYIVRLNVDGSLENNFGMGTDGTVFSIIPQQNGKILLGGNFTTFNGIPYNYIVRLQGDPIYYHTIRGNIYTDGNNDCNFQTSENRLPSVVIKALPGPYYGGSDGYGNYQVRVDSGTVTYTLSQQYNSINSKFLVNQCASSHNVAMNGVAKDTCCFNFADSVKTCAVLNINVQNTRMRRCFRGNTFVSYCNYGNVAASSAQIRVVYPSYIVPISSVPMWTSKQDSVLIYDIGTLTSDACNQIIITDSVICGNESIRGLTQCIKATISPASNCVAENPAWDRSSMRVTGTCNSTTAHFTITNGGSGNMADSLEYRVYVNDTLVFTGNYKLNSGESFNVDYPAQGQTIRVEADQHPLHPGKSRPRETVENCGVASPEVRNLVTTAPQDDLDEETAITCNQIIDSYDPNDKQTMPEGIGATNIIAPGTELEYTIRFQNTGTDTAYTVRVIDTLDIALDAGSFTEGASSHPYTLNISGKNQAVLAFNFYNINLPDKNVNEPGSNGLVSFRVKVPDTTSLGTVIKNKAHIFFDYNSAIITNATMHTVDVVVPSDLAKGSLVQVGQVTTGLSKKFSGSVKIYPNPTQGIITVEIPEQGNNTEMRVVSVLGVVQKSVQLNTTKQEVNLEGINQGMYLYEIWQEGERKAGGMLQVK